jgi:hypothetical protein
MSDWPRSHRGRCSAAVLVGLVFLRTTTAVAQQEWQVEEGSLFEIDRIGKIDGLELEVLNEVMHILVDGDGQLFVTQFQTPWITVFDPRTRLARRIGRSGQGPGELVAPGRLGWVGGDSLWVADVVANRVTVFKRDGEYVRTVRGPNSTSSRAYIAFVPVGLVADGGLLVKPVTSFRYIEYGMVTSVPLLKRPSASDGEDLALGSLYEGQGQIQLTLGPSRHVRMLDPFPQNTLWSLSPNGRSLSFVDRDETLDATFRITTVNLSGDTTMTRDVLDAHAVAMTNGRWEDKVSALVDGLSRNNAGYSRSRIRRALEEALRRPRNLPAATALVVARNLDLWVRREDTGLPSAVWDVFDLLGVHKQRLTAPANVKILAADETGAWGVVKDDLDVPFIVRLVVRPR